MDRRQYYPVVDLLRVVAIFGIVGCHLNLPNMTHGAEILKRYTDYNVGVFAALAGFFLFSSHDADFTTYVKKRAKRLLPSYFVWTFIYVAFSTALHVVQGRGVDGRLFTMVGWADILLRGNSSCHLWFVISLFYAQILLWWPKVRMRPGWVWLVLATVTILIADAGSGWLFFYPIRLLGFVMLGGWLRAFSARFPGWTPVRIAAVCLVVAVGIVLLGCSPRHVVIGEYVMTLPLCVVAICSPSVWFGRQAGWLAKLAGLTFAVYLVHPLITAALQIVVVRLFPLQGVSVFLADQVVAFGISMVLAVAYGHLSQAVIKWWRAND